jgi:hypothetical protein
MATTALSWEEIVERGKQHNRTVICEVEKRGTRRYFKVKCDECGNELFKRLDALKECRQCFINRVSCNITEFIYKSNAKHQGKYDYGLVEYQHSHIKVKIKCKTCNNIFLQTPGSHLKGNGCPICAPKSKSNTEEFIKKAIKIHGNKFNYELVDYILSIDNVKIKCNQCNSIFEQSPNSHLSGKGCLECRKSNTEEFIKKAIEIHGNKFNYDLTDYVTNIIKVKLICNTCNIIFEQTPNKHLRGIGCPKCNESKGENKIAKYLSDKNIRYTRNKIFKTLKDKSYLKPDFYLEDQNLLIEYDGVQHYKPTFGSTIEAKQKNLEDTQRKDKIKNEWAKANNIPLLRIPYWDFDRIEELIEAFILQHSKKKEIKQLVLEM